MITFPIKILVFSAFSAMVLIGTIPDVFAATITKLEVVRSFNIKAQPLGKAILSFSEQTNIVVSVKKALTDGKKAPLIRGYMTGKQALTLIFSGTGLKYLENKDGSATVLKANDFQNDIYPKNDEKALTTSIAKEPYKPHIEEILVTATKRSEKLQNVPIAITALSARDVESRQSRDLTDLSTAVPNMLMLPAMGTGEVNIAIRGLRGITGRSSGSAVGVYVDGVYQANLQTLNVGLIDIERIEVLKGPQGTLFGKDTIGGAVNITTKKPGNYLRGKLLAEYGNFDRRRLKASIDLPIIEQTLTARFSAQQEWEEGYVLNQFNEAKLGAKDRFIGRAQIYFTPNDQLNLRISYNHLETDDVPTTGEPINNFQGDLVPYTININGEVSRRVNAESLSVSVDYELTSGYALSSISSFNHTTDRSVQDTDFTSAPHLYEIFSGQSKEYSQELRISSPTGKSFDYIIGGYFFKNDSDKQDVYEIGVEPYLLSLGYPPELASPEHPIQDGQERDFISQNVAAFLHGNYYVSDDLTLYGGLRITSDKKKTNYSIFGSLLSFLDFDTIENYISRTSDTPLSWMLGARYHFNKDLMGYVTLARGFRGSAIKDYFISLDDISAGRGFFSKPEYVTNYETGFKLQTLENRLQANGAVFYMDYTDIISQIQTNGSFTSILLNASSAWILGSEIDLKLQASPNMLLTASAGFLKSKYGKFLPTPELDLTGQTLGNFPQWTLSSSFDYSLPLQGGAVLTAHGDVSYKSTYIVLHGGTVQTKIGNYAVVNASLGYLPAGSGWKLRLWARNLLNTNAPTTGTNWNAGQGYQNDHFVYIYEHPRSFGVTLGIDL